MQGKEVIELIREDKSQVTIEQVIGELPKKNQKKAAFEMITTLHQELTDILVRQKLTEAKIKKLHARLELTEPVKSLKSMKKQVSKNKKDAEKLALILLGAKRMCKSLDIELPNIKALLED
jgi:cell division ATPase FtsA